MDTSTNATAESLRRYLNSAREAIIWKCEDLSPKLARTPMTPTGTHILGIVHHLAITEYGYFTECLGRPVLDPYIQEVLEIDDPQADFCPPEHFTMHDVLDLYRASIASAEQAFDELELDSPAEVPWWNLRRHTTVENLMVHMISETARHGGHLDIVRELLDGQVGVMAQATNIPSFTPEQWRERHTALQRIADQSSSDPQVKAHP